MTAHAEIDLLIERLIERHLSERTNGLRRKLAAQRAALRELQDKRGVSWPDPEEPLVIEFAGRRWVPAEELARVASELARCEQRRYWQRSGEWQLNSIRRNLPKRLRERSDVDPVGAVIDLAQENRDFCRIILDAMAEWEAAADDGVG